MNQPMTTSASSKLQPGHPLALAEHDEERHEPPRRPEEREPALHEEVEPVLHRDRRGGAELDPEEAQVAEHADLSLRTQRNGAAPLATRAARRSRAQRRRPTGSRARRARRGRGVMPDHHLDRERQHVAERQEPGGDLEPAREQLERDEVAGEHAEQAEPDLEERARRLDPERERADDGHGEEGDEPRADDRDREEREEERIAREPLASGRDERDPRRSGTTAPSRSGIAPTFSAAYATSGWMGRRSRYASVPCRISKFTSQITHAPVMSRTTSAAR